MQKAQRAKDIQIQQQSNQPDQKHSNHNYESPQNKYSPNKGFAKNDELMSRFVDEFAKMEAGSQNAVQLGKLEGHLMGLINT